MDRIAVAWLVFTIVASVVYSAEDDVNGEWKSHLRRVSHIAFPCQDPQKRTVDVEELVDKETWSKIGDLRIMPRRTVLQTCYSAGSCLADTFRCQPTNIAERHLIFGVKDQDGHLTFKNITAEDHLSCMCQESSDLPK